MIVLDGARAATRLRWCRNAFESDARAFLTKFGTNPPVPAHGNQLSAPALPTLVRILIDYSSPLNNVANRSKEEGVV